MQQSIKLGYEQRRVEDGIGIFNLIGGDETGVNGVGDGRERVGRADTPNINTPKKSMASSADPWVREYNEAARLADDINGMISERSSLSASGPEGQRYASAIRRKITILGTRLDSLQSLLGKLPGKQPLTEKEMNRRKDMLANLRSKVNQMASTLNMSNFANRDSLLGPDKQDEGLDKLEETVISTKHIALAVNEELDLHTRLIDNLDQHVDVTDSRLKPVPPKVGSHRYLHLY
ncbi:hypothetical protein HYC85_011446 [Camellia sinensis]|uniref:t-SNARE coiled-coil homology domain-containing protein n=1 Tax=Camellia sinensis TaxID=4442 RepID=A0A7J7H923_CAMSI|nr:hypothetical protein HYC85_011446 [Camellia sinensis]